VSDTQPRWDKALADKGLSQSSLAAKAGVSKATVNRMVNGQGRPDAASVRKVAEILTDGDTDLVWKLLGTGHADYGDFPLAQIEDDLRLLTPKQRKALISIVRSMSDPEGKRLGHVATPAEKKDDEVARRRAEREAAGGVKKAARNRKSDETPEN
jgi:transcriptional regulator with XRE-family HTH domain